MMTELEGIIKMCEECGALSKEESEEARVALKGANCTSKGTTGEVWIGDKQHANEKMELMAIGEKGFKVLAICIEELGIEVMLNGNEAIELLKRLEE